MLKILHQERFLFCCLFVMYIDIPFCALQMFSPLVHLPSIQCSWCAVPTPLLTIDCQYELLLKLHPNPEGMHLFSLWGLGFDFPARSLTLHTNCSFTVWSKVTVALNEWRQLLIILPSIWLTFDLSYLIDLKQKGSLAVVLTGSLWPCLSFLWEREIIMSPPWCPRIEWCDLG